MQNESVSQQTEDFEALADLITMGLVEVVFDAEHGPMYRLNEQIQAADWTPNAALLERLE